MNARTFILLTGIAASTSFGQGFINLSFEDAVIVPISGNNIQFAPAFPGWSGYFGTTPASSALYNSVSLNGISDFALLTTNSSLSVFPLADRFSAVLQSSTFDADLDVSLAQTGMVPVGTSSLRFLGLNSPHPFFVTMNGQTVNPIILQNFGSYMEYGADISVFAGQTAELRFTQPHGTLQ